MTIFVCDAIQNVTSIGIQTVQETTLAIVIVDSTSSIEQSGLVNSETEAVTSAIRHNCFEIITFVQ